MYIYLLRNKINGKFYVGQTTMPPDRRLAEHKYRGEHPKYHHLSAIASAIHKYGWEAFDQHVLEVCQTVDELNEAEDFWIKKYDSLAPNGYNLRHGGGSKGKVSDATKEKMRQAQLGKRHTPETRSKMGKNRIGVPLAREHALKIGQALKGTKRGPPSDAHRKAMSEAAKRKMERGGREAVSGENNGHAILTWAIVAEIRKDAADMSMADIAKKYNIAASHVSNILSNKTWKVPEKYWTTKEREVASGNSHPLAKLDWSSVAEIRRQAASGVGRKELSAKFSVCLSTIGQIVRGEIWKAS